MFCVYVPFSSSAMYHKLRIHSSPMTSDKAWLYLKLTSTFLRLIFSKPPNIFQSVLCFIEICEPYCSSYGTFPCSAAPELQSILQDKDKKYSMITPPFGHLVRDSSSQADMCFPDHKYGRQKPPSNRRCSFS